MIRIATVDLTSHWGEVNSRLLPNTLLHNTEGVSEPS